MQRSERPEKTIRRVAFIAFGFVFVLGGFIGLLLPVVPGAFLIVVGILMLSPRLPWVRRALAKSRARFPFADRIYARLSAWWESQASFIDRPRNPGSQIGA